MNIYGERFAQGDAELALRWHDRQQGIAGADVDLRSFVLEKARPATETHSGATGTVLGSVSIRRGGALTANVMLEGIPRHASIRWATSRRSSTAVRPGSHT